METARGLSRNLRERALAFARFVWHRFDDEQCFSAAGTLSFTTVFALVPQTTAVFGILAAVPVFQQWSDRISDFVFTHFVPAAAQAMQTYLLDFAGNAKRLTTAGALALLVSALVMMSSVEESFNRIFRAPARKRRLARFVVYWTVLTLGPILIAGSLGLSSYLLALPGVEGRVDAWHLGERLLRVLPYLVTWGALALAYLVVPNAPVRFRHAAVGGLLASLLFEATKQAFAQYLSQASYEQVYGVLAAVPIFLLWIYLSWVVVLVGASITASLSAFRYVPREQAVTPGLEFGALLRIYGRIAAASSAGEAPTRNALAAAEPALSDGQLDRVLAELSVARCIHRSELGTFGLLRDPAGVPLAELFAGGPYRWPDVGELAQAQAGLAAGAPAVMALLAAGAVAQDGVLSRPAADVLSA
ncbi:MAG: YihY family inner membrane protein [Pseudomonadota bacterium]